MKKRRSFKEINLEIHNRSREFDESHKKECSLFNWKARLIAFLVFRKKVYPTPSQKEVEAFSRVFNFKLKRKEENGKI